MDFYWLTIIFVILFYTNFITTLQKIKEGEGVGGNTTYGIILLLILIYLLQ